MMKQLLTATVFLTCLTGLAQQDSPRAFEMIRSSESYRNAVTSIYQSYETALSSHCPKIELNMNTSEANIVAPFETDASGAIVSGHWKETTAGTACGQRRLYNASVAIEKGRPLVLLLFPGHSYASPLLQHDAVRYAAIGAGSGEGCVAEILDTALPNGKPSGPKAPWVEKWTVRTCGKQSLVTLHFVPDATGTTINVSLKETVPLP